MTATPVTILPDYSDIGIVTDSDDYDIIIGFHIANTGFDYCNPTVIEIYDRDRKSTSNGEARAIVVEGRIVEVDLINNGSGFKRIPEIRIYDDGKTCGSIRWLRGRNLPHHDYRS